MRLPVGTRQTRSAENFSSWRKGPAAALPVMLKSTFSNWQCRYWLKPSRVFQVGLCACYFFFNSSDGVYPYPVPAGMHVLVPLLALRDWRGAGVGL